MVTLLNLCNKSKETRQTFKLGHEIIPKFRYSHIRNITQLKSED